jgi:hypothetical protein
MILQHDCARRLTCSAPASGRTKVLNWLVTVNPSYNHNQALDLHQKGTCEWVLECKEWQQWVKGVKDGIGGRRGLWIHGIPGAGKTILSSFLATQVLELRDQANLSKSLVQTQSPSEFALSTASVYYYCHHGRSHDEFVPFLSWLLSQLCRQAEFIPPNIRNLFEGDCQPRPEDLEIAIQLVAVHFSKIVVSIDAVDESHNREVLTQWLMQLATSDDYPKFHVLVTSRQESDIERFLSKEFIVLPMSNDSVDQDIRKFIEQQVIADRTMRLWSKDLQKKVKDSVSSAAEGM